jgi:hypothetical protein
MELNPKELLLAQSGEGLTALHKAAYGIHVGILQKVWGWAGKRQLNFNELKTNLLQAKTMRGTQRGTMQHD